MGQQFHGMQQPGGRGQADHLQGTYRLVQLLAGNAQLAAIKLCHIRAARQVGIAHKATDRLGGTVQGLFQLVQHPRQRAQIIVSKLSFTRSGFVRLHGFSLLRGYQARQVRGSGI